MDRNGVKVFLAVAIGIGLGMLAGSSVHSSFGWLVGAVVGGGAGYLGFAPIEALQHLRTAWQRARGIPLLDLFRVVRWWGYATTTIVMCSILVIIGMTWLTQDSIVMTHLFRDLFFFASIFAIFLGTFTGLFALLFSDSEGVPTAQRYIDVDQWIGREWSADARAWHLDGAAAGLATLVYTFLPFGVLGYHLPRGLYALAKHVPDTARFVGRVLREWALLMHSDERLLCGAYAFLLAGIGLRYGGSTIAWMIGGGAFGVLHYEVLTKRYLVPRGLVTIRVREK